MRALLISNGKEDNQLGKWAKRAAKNARFWTPAIMCMSDELWVLGQVVSEPRDASERLKL